MTRDELRGIIEGISDEQLKKILDINSSDIGKAKSNFEELKAQLEASELKSAELEERVSVLQQGQSDAEKMKDELERLQKVIDQKNQAEQERCAKDELFKRFDAASKGAEFVNDFTRNGVFEQFKAALADEKNIGKADGEIYGELTADKEGIFAEKKDMPSVIASTAGFGGAISDNDVREIMGLAQN